MYVCVRLDLFAGNVCVYVCVCVCSDTRDEIEVPASCESHGICTLHVFCLVSDYSLEPFFRAPIWGHPPSSSFCTRCTRCSFPLDPRPGIRRQGLV